MIRRSDEAAASTEPGLSLTIDHPLDRYRLAVSLALPGSGVSALFGPSGSGKTSLLRLIAGLDRPESGRVQLGDTILTDTRSGIHVPPHRRGIGVVFQEARLFPHYRVRGNLRYGMRSDASHYRDIVSQLGLGDLLDRYPATLSGGEARRVAIGRTLLTRPRLLLLDEPLAGLDAPRQRQLLAHIRELVRALSIPIIYISHDAGEIAAIADHLTILDQGQRVADGPLDEVLARFELTPHLGGFDALAVLSTTLTGHDPAYGLSHLALPDGQEIVTPTVDRSPGAPVRVRVPIRDVAIAVSDPVGTSYLNRLHATIEASCPSTDEPGVMELRLTVADQLLRARLTRRSYEELGLAVGSPVVALVRSVAFDQP